MTKAAGNAPLRLIQTQKTLVLATADALLVRPVADPARRAGDTVEYLEI